MGMFYQTYNLAFVSLDKVEFIKEEVDFPIKFLKLIKIDCTPVHLAIAAFFEFFMAVT